MVGEAVPDEASARLEGNHDVSCNGYVGVADLPVSPPKVQPGAFFVRFGDDVETPVFGCGLVQGKPDAGYGGIYGNVEVGAVLVPGFFPADARGFDEGHVLEEDRGFTH